MISPEEAIEAVAESPQHNPSSAFGANEWLVDEMYERYRQDPSSVDKEWWDFFQDFTPDASGDAAGPSSTDNGRPGPGTESEPATPAPRSRPVRASAGASDPDKPGPAKSSPTEPTTSQPSTNKPAAAKPAAVDRPATTGPESPAASGARPDGAQPTPKEHQQPEQAGATDEPEHVVLRGAPARTVTNMDASLAVPTATSVRSVPVKLLIDNRIVINNHLARARGGKVSFTHLVGYALVKALRDIPEMNVGFDVIDGKPNLIKPRHINLGLAIDLPKSDGTRQLLVPSIKAAETMDFATFWTAYEEVVRRTRDNKLTLEDFQGTTVTLTNPGTIGTSHSVPRLMKGQGAIIGVGAMEHPPAYQGAAEETLARLAVSKTMTLTSTYDHRVIQGALSGEFLRRLHAL
ncbi:MAG TPA: 2-oxo acid dehydrogenase subunit E2, partial [Nocardioidaceae bacterium]|nr:2-oxo acid dehydrogenase subunit E2 [Nocardioidaceae bacterium]